MAFSYLCCGQAKVNGGQIFSHKCSDATAGMGTMFQHHHQGKPGADPGFWERRGLINIFTTGGGYGGGRAPSRDSKGVWGSADSSPSGVWGEAPAAFLLLRLFSLKFTVISNTYTSRDIRITRACMDSDEKTVHSSQCYGSYCSAIKFVTQSFCEFVTEACTWPSKHQLYVGL